MNSEITVKLSEMKPYLERMKGRTFNQKKYIKLKYNKIRKIFNWLKSIHESVEWMDFVRICREFEHNDILKYQIQGLTDLTEYRAFFKKRKAIRRLWNVSFPQEIRNESKKSSKKFRKESVSA